MSKRPNDPLITEIQSELMPGHFFRPDEVSELVDNLERLHGRLQALAKSGEAAMAEAAGAGLGEFISLCVKTREWDRLAQRVHLANPSELEDLRDCLKIGDDGKGMRI